MPEKRKDRAKLNMLTTILRQLLATLCGIVIPRVMIGAFGSLVYGATTSISQFLSYISLLESGIGRVARGALYSHLARDSKENISKVYHAIKSFFRHVGIFFVVYAVILALSYFKIADVSDLSYEYTVGLVLAISISTAANYFFGIANMTLIHADQKQYLTNTIITLTNVINTVFIVLLIQVKADVMTVKLVSSLVFLARPVLYARHVKKHYDLPKVQKDPNALSQKWTGMGQHIAYFLHTNTDIVLLTVFSDLKLVAVYSVYHLVINSIWNIASAFSGGMEAAFGEMIAKDEKTRLAAAYRKYKLILTVVAMVLFGCTAVLLIPFVRLYMADVTDANYIQPVFGMLLLSAEFINCLVLPCTTLPISANALKKTRWGSYGEALINIGVSLILIQWNPLVGVAMGTLLATVFKAVYYIHYTAKRILKCSAWSLFGKFILSLTVMLVISVGGMLLLWQLPMKNFFVWTIWGGISFLVVGALTLAFCKLLFPAEVKSIFNKLSRK